MFRYYREALSDHAEAIPFPDYLGVACPKPIFSLDLALMCHLTSALHSGRSQVRISSRGRSHMLRQIVRWRLNAGI